MTLYYDDNYGFQEINDEDDLDFYNMVQSQSVLKTCQGCGGQFKLRPDYAYCTSCADVIEAGGDLGY